MVCQGSIPNFFENFPIFFQTLAAEYRRTAIPFGMTATADDLTVVGSSHLGPASLWRLAKRDGGIVVVTIVTGFDGDESQLEHVKTFRVCDALIIQ